ncbi:RhuM family protein [uncultured Alsobacter sp.]|uniref:RhuM family protein n=1 Tax=uncultured Alsobacter sp. TaxID=1748258 RepID=UPI0025D7E5FE|nr:RhuM family protein [uncultured Alsobacter sp.]
MKRNTKKGSAAATHAAANHLETAVVQFTSGDTSLDFNIDVTAETVWATQQQMADLYGKDRRTIAEHFKNAVDEGELDHDAVCRKFRHTGSDGKSYEVAHFNLDAILAVGYRVKSPRATQFRKWATRVLTEYLVKGAALNTDRLGNDAAAAAAVAERLRELRHTEKNKFRVIRDAFATAIDYDPKSSEARRFFTLLQDKFEYAITMMPAAEIKLVRADYKKPNMGVVTFEGRVPTLAEASVAKNYLSADELRLLNILCEQFVLYVEAMQHRNRPMTMAQLNRKIDEILTVNEYPVFPGYSGKKAVIAERHVKAQHALFQVGFRRPR